MNLCNYNWNIIILGMLRYAAVRTANIGITANYKSERFIIENNNGGDVWLDKDLGTNVYKYNLGFFVGSGDFAVNYTIYEINKMEIEFHRKVR